MEDPVAEVGPDGLEDGEEGCESGVSGEWGGVDEDRGGVGRVGEKKINCVGSQWEDERELTGLLSDLSWLLNAALMRHLGCLWVFLPSRRDLAGC